MSDRSERGAAGPERRPPADPTRAASGAVPRISVVVPAHDAARRLPRALRSVLAQSVADLEVIVVDDASRDDTLAVARTFARRDPRVRVLHSPVNLGPGGARNLGLDAARGTWIALLDSDDAFRPNRLLPLLRAAADADMVADNLLLLGAEDGVGGRPMLPTALLDRPRAVDAEAFLAGNLPIRGHPRVSYGFLKPMLRRAFLDGHQLRYRHGLRFAEDFDFYLRCLLAGGRFVLLPEAGYAYTVRGDSLTARHGPADLVRLRALCRDFGRQVPSGSGGLGAAVAAHARSVERRLVWRMVTESLARGRLRRALRLATRSPDSALVVGRELLRAVPLHLLHRVRRRLARARPPGFLLRS